VEEGADFSWLLKNSTEEEGGFVRGKAGGGNLLKKKKTFLGRPRKGILQWEREESRCTEKKKKHYLFAARSHR